MRALSKPSALHLPDLASLDQPSQFNVKLVPADEPLRVQISGPEEDPHNPRTETPDADELAAGIRQHGILQPVVVHAADGESRHQIHFGAKRWRAAQRIGLLEVPVVVRDRCGATSICHA